MYFGSLFHCGSILLVIGVAALQWLLLKKKKIRVQKTVVLCLMLLNTVQHFLKFLIYPQYRGTGFSLYSTAYNVCAVLIISAPLIFLWGSRFLKNFLYFVGLTAGIGAVCYPFWFFGTPVKELGWNYFRFYLCHGLLFVSCILPLLLGLHKPKYQEFWQIGLGFLLTLCVILVNNVIFMSIGLYPEEAEMPLYEQLLNVNPCMMMAPKGDFLRLSRFLECFSPSAFLGHNPSGRYAPILWYALPVYAGICVIGFLLFAVLDRKAFCSDIKRTAEKYRKNRKND